MHMVPIHSQLLIYFECMNCVNTKKYCDFFFLYFNESKIETIQRRQKNRKHDQFCFCDFYLIHFFFVVHWISFVGSTAPFVGSTALFVGCSVTLNYLVKTRPDYWTSAPNEWKKVYNNKIFKIFSTKYTFEINNCKDLPV